MSQENNIQNSEATINVQNMSNVSLRSELISYIKSNKNDKNDKVIKKLDVVPGKKEIYINILSVAILHKNIEITKIILAKYLNTDIYELQFNPLFIYNAILPDKSDQKLSENQKNNYGEEYFPFQVMAGIGGSIEVFNYLSENNLINIQNINATGMIGLTKKYKNIFLSNIVGACAYYGNDKLLNYILETYENKLSINFKTTEKKSNITEIHLSKEFSGYTPLLLAVGGKATDQKTVEILKIFFRFEADFRARDFEGNNIIHIATKEEKIESLKFLVEFLGLKTFINEKNNHDETPQIIAKQNNNKDIIDFLNLYLKKDENIPDTNKEELIQYNGMYQNIEMDNNQMNPKTHPFFFELNNFGESLNFNEENNEDIKEAEKNEENKCKNELDFNNNYNDNNNDNIDYRIEEKIVDNKIIKNENNIDFEKNNINNNEDYLLYESRKFDSKINNYNNKNYEKNEYFNYNKYPYNKFNKSNNKIYYKDNNYKINKNNINNYAYEFGYNKINKNYSHNYIKEKYFNNKDNYHQKRSWENNELNNWKSNDLDSQINKDKYFNKYKGKAKAIEIYDWKVKEKDINKEDNKNAHLENKNDISEESNICINNFEEISYKTDNLHSKDNNIETKDEILVEEEEEDYSDIDEDFLSHHPEKKVEKFVKNSVYSQLYENYLEMERKVNSLEKEKTLLKEYIRKIYLNKNKELIPNEENGINDLLKLANEELNKKDKEIIELKKETKMADLSNIKNIKPDKLKEYKDFYSTNLKIINDILKEKENV